MANKSAYFVKRTDGKRYKEIDTLGIYNLPYIFGQTITDAMTDVNGNLEAVRIRHGNTSYILYRRFNDLKMTIYG